MAASELQERLDYLVSYACQLIFINGETADQSSVLDTFIRESTEQVEIALLTATPTTVLAQYREKIYRQLVSKTQNADFGRPLNQLLVALNQHNGPLIISISKAENLPDKIVQELWELVLQSRFANNKQLLNVLLFAQGNWAKQTRDKLQSRTGDKPLLLNNSVKLSALRHNTSELDKLINLKRQQFSERLQKRAEGQPRSVPLLKRKSVIACFVGIFILLFTGIISLQYPSVFYPEKATESVIAATSQQASGLEPATLAITEQPLVGESTSDVLPIETSAAAEAITADEEQVITHPQLTDTTTSSPDELVTSWQDAIAKIDDPKQYMLAKPQEAFIAQQDMINQEPDSDSIAPTVQTSKVNSPKNPRPVPVEVTPQIATRQPTASLAPLPNGLTLQNGQYLIQISAMSDNYLLQQFMQESPLSQQVWTYTTQRFGGDWFVLIYNQVYPSLDVARAALEKLPPSITAYEPFIKSVKQIKQELAQKGV